MDRPFSCSRITTPDTSVECGPSHVEGKTSLVSLTDFPDEILLMIQRRLAEESVRDWISLSRTCRRLNHLSLADETTWRVLAYNRIRLPYWWTATKPRSGCVYGGHRNWSSACVSIMRCLVPSLNCVYILLSETQDLKNRKLYIMKCIKLFPNGCFAKSAVKSKTPSVPETVLDHVLYFGEWRVSDKKLVLKWVTRTAEFADFEVGSRALEIAELGHTKVAIGTDHGWSYYFEPARRHSAPMRYTAYSDERFKDDWASLQVIAAMATEVQSIS